MQEILLVIQLIVALALVGVILVQHSEGGALGIGGGGAMSARGTANLLTRATTVLAIIFISLSLLLTIVQINSDDNISVLDDPTEEQVDDTPRIPDSN
ncbi:MAG: preprotein translocase subunit SecG [Alphaproteobacteria bacterium]|nr:preprotein translocase subunit SecG [Alphaproteobacteria bacterium]